MKDSKVLTERKKAVDLHKEQKRQVELLRSLVEDKAKGAAPPKWVSPLSLHYLIINLFASPSPNRYHYETRQEQQEIIFSHLRDNEMEIQIVGCSNLHVPHEITTVDPYVYAVLPYPSATSPQKLQTPSVSGTVDPCMAPLSPALLK